MNEPASDYYTVGMMVSGSNVNHIDFTICKRCGNIVGNVFQHDNWHDSQTTKEN